MYDINDYNDILPYIEREVNNHFANDYYFGDFPEDAIVEFTASDGKSFKIDLNDLSHHHFSDQQWYYWQFDSMDDYYIIIESNYSSWDGDDGDYDFYVGEKRPVDNFYFAKA